MTDIENIYTNVWFHSKKCILWKDCVRYYKTNFYLPHTKINPKKKSKNEHILPNKCLSVKAKCFACDLRVVLRSENHKYGIQEWNHDCGVEFLTFKFTYLKKNIFVLSICTPVSKKRKKSIRHRSHSTYLLRQRNLSLFAHIQNPMSSPVIK